MKKIRQTFKDMDKVLLLVSIILFVFGLFNIVTASSQASVLRYNQSLYNYFYKQLAVLLIGFVGTIVILCFPTKTYHLFSRIAVGIIGMICVFVVFKGETYSGNTGWISLGSFQFQPSEFAKPVIVVFLAVLFEEFHKKLKNEKTYHWDMIGKILLAVVFFPAVVFFQKDIGTTIILTILAGTMYLASPILRLEKIKAGAFFVGVCILALGVIYLVNGHIFNESQKSRFDFYDPCSKYEEGGYQICNGFIAINSGGIKGVGIGKSRQKSYIPESHTDSVFAIIAEEYGFLMTSFILFLFVVVIYRILKLASVVGSVRGKYICLGMATYIFLHILVNLGGLFASLPLTGVPLPFLSYGGSYTLSLVISLAIVQRVHIEYKNQKIKI